MSFDPNTDLPALKSELENDPIPINYLKTGGVLDHQFDAANADLINAKIRTINAANVNQEAIRAGVTFDSYDGLSIDEQEWLRWMTPNSGQLVVTDDVLLQLTGSGDPTNSMWAAADRVEMVAAMEAVIQILGSRAEELFGIGSNITPSDIANAVNLP